MTNNQNRTWLKNSVLFSRICYYLYSDFNSKTNFNPKRTKTHNSLKRLYV